MPPPLLHSNLADYRLSLGLVVHAPPVAYDFHISSRLSGQSIPMHDVPSKRWGEHRDARPHQGGDKRFIAAASGPL